MENEVNNNSITSSEETKEMPKNMKLCRHCGAQMAAGATVCPKCGGKNKKPIYKRVWFIILVVLVALLVFGSLGGGDDSDSSTPSGATSAESGSTGDSSTAAPPEEESEPITYTAYTVGQLQDDLDANALKAADKYTDQYVELTGELDTIDSSGDYITIISGTEIIELGIQCYIKSEEQKNTVMELSTGDTLVVKGQITDVGELLGYSMNIDEISKAG